MIHEVKGDILLSDAEVICHGVAPNDNFEQGLPFSLREQWPAMYKDFRHNMHSQRPKEGGIVVWACAEGKRIVHLLSQEHSPVNNAHPGEAKLKYVNHVLRELRVWIDKEDVNSVALPRLATGVGKMDWNEVKPLIEQHLGDAACNTYVYVEYQKGLKANEG